MIAERYLTDRDGVVVASLAVRELGIRDERFEPSGIRFSLRFRTPTGEPLGSIAVPTGRAIEEYLDDELRFLLSLVRDVEPAG